MKLKLVKASQGLEWVRQGMLACRKQALGYIGLLGLTGLVALLLVGLPARVGALLVVALMPLMWMGFMIATRRVLTGERVTPAVMVEPVKGKDSPRREFAQLGGAYVVATLLVMQLAQWLGPDPEALEAAMDASKEATELLADPMVQQDMLWRMALTIPVSLVFWHTPALVLWARLPVGKALFFSAVATWRNLGAFAVYGLGWGAALLLLGLFDRALLALTGSALLANMVAVAAGMWLAAAFYASLYFTVVDCFEPERPAGSPSATELPDAPPPAD